jgi:hypothetical protein
MTTVANLLARKQTLLDRLQNNPGPHERDEIARLFSADRHRVGLARSVRPNWR